MKYQGIQKNMEIITEENLDVSKIDPIKASRARQTRKKVSINISPASRRRPPPVRRKKQPEIVMPLPQTPEQKFAEQSQPIDASGIVDNTKSKVKKSDTKFGVKHSNFLITFVPNTSVRETYNPDFYKKVKEEIKSFVQFVFDPKNIDTVLMPSPDNKDPDWVSKVRGYTADKVASIEDSKETTKKLHTHIYLPVEHNTKILVNQKNLRDIAKIMLEGIGWEGKPHLNVKVAFGQGIISTREYILKQGGETIEP